MGFRRVINKRNSDLVGARSLNTQTSLLSRKLVDKCVISGERRVYLSTSILIKQTYCLYVCVNYVLDIICIGDKYAI